MKNHDLYYALCQFVSYTLDIEAVSCDEMFIDCVGLLAETASSPFEFASMLRQEIHDKTGCTASVGIGSLSFLFSLFALFICSFLMQVVFVFPPKNYEKFICRISFCACLLIFTNYVHMINYCLSNLFVTVAINLLICVGEFYRLVHALPGLCY